MEGEESSLEGLGDLALHMILYKLGPEDTARVSCVSKRFKLSASDDSLWSKFCFDDLDLSSPQDQHGDRLPSFCVAYHHWRVSFGMYPWSLVKRVKRCWGSLENWLSNNFPEAEATLRRGVTESDIDQLETLLKVELPLPTRVLYRFHDGQGLIEQVDSESSLVSTLGIIGGYSFYNHFVNVYLLPIHQIIVETKKVMRLLGVSRKSKYIVVAASSTHSHKLFFLNCISGQLHVGTRHLLTDREMIPCVPGALLQSVNETSGGYQQDAMLLWLEEHARRLHNGIIKLQSGVSRSISLFPEAPPLCSTCVTNGVQVRASAVFVPELTLLHHDSETYVFAYSIHMSLMPEGCMVDGATFSSCQLYWRHWTIRADEAVVSDVANGEGVIGKFPLLYPGGEEFVYESATHLQSETGSMEGYFTFVPGRLSDPKGGHFKVEVACFPLQRPDYVY